MVALDQTGQTGSAPTALRFGILGSMLVELHGGAVDAGPRKQQIVLAALLSNANSLVSVDALAEALWLGSPPRTARKNIQVYLSTLRGMARSGAGPRISHQNGGYVLHVEPVELDALRFEQLVRDASRLRGMAPASSVADALSGALSLWRGRALDGMRDVPLLAAAAERLDRQFLATFEDWAEAEIETGSGASVAERIAEVAQQQPLRERLRILQMTALCEAGRRTEALAVYDELRRSLARELGLSPSSAVEAFYQSVLHGQSPPIQPSGRPPCRLPWDPPHFTGRVDLTRQVTDTVGRGRQRLVVAMGPLGVGKTALAVHAAHQLGDRFPDGRFFVRVRDAEGKPRPIEQIVSEVMPPAQRERTAWRDDQRQTWQRWLAGARALVILDDVRKESDVLPLLPETGDSAVIVTARSRLAGLESACRLMVPPLPVAAALDYLRQAIGAHRVAADPCSAEHIVRAVGLLPHGVRLVAERLALLHYVPLREYAARLADPPSLLDELAAGDPTLRPRLADAIGELPEQVRRGVARLGTLSDAEFTLTEAAVVLDVDERAALRALESLLEACLITVPGIESFAHAVRYRMPPITYAHVREVASALPGGSGVR